MVSIALTLGFVLVLLGVSLALLRRFMGGANRLGRLKMEVVQRLALNSKQSIAVVRVADRMVVVSMGDGGIRRLFELEESEVAVAAAPPARVAAATEQTQTASSPIVEALAARRSRMDFGQVLDSVRGASTAVTVALLALVLSVAAPVRAVAQQPMTEAGRRLMEQVQAQQRVAERAATLRATRPAAPSPAPVADNVPVVRPPATSTSAAPALAASIASSPAGLSASPASPTLPSSIDLRMGGADGLRLSGTVGVVVMMGLLTLLPALLLMMTGFTRILIVLHFVRQALGAQSAPPAQLVAGLALLLTGFVMAPTLTELNKTALEPWMDGKITQAEMLKTGAAPLRTFMLRQTRRQDIETFVRMSGQAAPESVEQLSTVTLTSAFVISELRTAFQMGFAIFLPFIVIDIAVSAVLMSMGMMMLPPAMIALPFKLLLFVLADGWSLVVQSLVTSFR
jgi:flagellar biosynthetic protein FliP